MWQCHSPIEPGRVDLHVFRIISRDDMVHGGNVAALLDCNGLASADCQRRKASSLGANMVCGDRTYWVHEPCVVLKAEDFFLCVRDFEFAIVIDQFWAGQKKRPLDNPGWCSFWESYGHRRKMWILDIWSLPDQKMREFGKLLCGQWRWGQSDQPLECLKCWQRCWNLLVEGWICIVGEDWFSPQVKSAGWLLQFDPTGDEWMRSPICRGQTAVG